MSVNVEDDCCLYDFLVPFHLHGMKLHFSFFAAALRIS
jgi:hypothetical protein